MKHPQFEYLVSEAQKRVAEHGNNAEFSDLMLAGFGFLRDELRPRHYNWRHLVTLGTIIGALVMGMMKTLWEFNK